MNKNYKTRCKAYSESKKKVLERQGDKSLVQWMGYPNSFNSWIDTKAILKLTTKNRFKTVEKKKQSLKHVLINTTKYH